MIEVTTQEQLIEVIHQSQDKDLFFFKHSTQCSLSSSAFLEFERFSEKHPEVDCYFIDLWDHRGVSNRLAEVSQVPHKSPQVIQYYQGKVVWDTSHRDITQQNLESHCHL